MEGSNRRSNQQSPAQGTERNWLYPPVSQSIVILPPSAHLLAPRRSHCGDSIPFHGLGNILRRGYPFRETAEAAAAVVESERYGETMNCGIMMAMVVVVESSIIHTPVTGGDSGNYSSFSFLK